MKKLPVAIIKSMRPLHWLKNGFVVMPIIFSKELFVGSAVATVFTYAFLFSLASSAVYLFNDIIDVNSDQLHPEKAHRPIAAGELPLAVAAVISLLLAISSLIGSAYISKEALAVLSIYLVINLLYSLVVKSVVVLDVIFIALGFVLRAVGGALVLNVMPSEWLILCTFLLALFLGFCKRRQELSLNTETAAGTRKSLENYTIPFTEALIMICGACTILSYAIYTLAPATVERYGKNTLIITIPFVIYGVFRYISLVLTRGKGDSPSLLLIADKPLLITVLSWAFTAALIIY
ncbi:MAG: decaprenyl-phosphate phosphoribosyltransferase [Fibrobacteres bacterium]|nr:decaprenyl-phosphate phosphoribosyltransferase [Fibrobacterota bacterium]